MYCSSCGNHLSEDARFCDRCGKPVVKITTGNQEQSENAGSPNTPATDQNSVYPGRDWVETGAAAFQEFTDSVRDVADNFGLDKWQRISAIIAACSLFLFVICITGTLASWLSVISGVMLLVFCLRKKKFDSVELALTMTVFIMRFVTVDIRVLFGADIYYPAVSIIMRFVFYGLAVIYWLAVTGRFSKKSGMAWVLVLSGVVTLYSAFDVFMSFPGGFRSVLFSAGRMGFFLCYVIHIGREQKLIGISVEN